VITTSGFRDPIERLAFDQKVLPEFLAQVSPGC
jgi:hypothetical protein